ncbi:MAG: bifunctional DNA-formamidopyrimidine glycosylase/DNA-(apurinic or apyrimidinic site) lyase [Actinobacteria bacterium]|nr:MAG: bifunctional DNA-formamidopyrimidine glycosylase/DNA-(apurinic or apyrimidinic site) lyase [Actinomycetota bacterium]
MPELPEVETIRSQLAPGLIGRRFERVQIDDPRLTRPESPDAVARELEGERVADVRRRGKYLVVAFESDRHLLVHLRMTGSLQHPARTDRGADPHRRAVVRLDDGSDVAYRDVRRFGTWTLLEPGELEEYLAARIGGEPLERSFTDAALARALAGRRAPVKGALLDQKAAAGIGNIYADEALWLARVHPRRPAGDLAPPEIAALRRGIRKALRTGIARQGATLRDYRDSRGARGRMQHEFHVYGREGEPCPRCGTPIEKTRVAGRGTWYCPACQPRPSDDPDPPGESSADVRQPASAAATTPSLRGSRES